MPQFCRPVVALLTLSIALPGVAVKSETATVKPGRRLLVVTGKDLNGKAWQAPADFPGGRTLVILGYEEEQQKEIDTWAAGLGLTQRENKLPWIEMPVIDEPGVIMRWIIDTGMQRGIPDKEVRSHVWTVYTNRREFLKSCGIESMNAIHVLIVTREGDVLAMESGGYTEEAGNRILAAVDLEKEPLRNTGP